MLSDIEHIGHTGVILSETASHTFTVKPSTKPCLGMRILAIVGRLVAFYGSPNNRQLELGCSLEVLYC